MTTVRHSLAGSDFSQDWSNPGLIIANDDWSGVPSIVAYLGDIDAGSPTGVDPRTYTGAALGAVDVIANQASTAINNGGVAEFDIADDTIALQGSGTADAPSLVLYLDATGRTDIRVRLNLRDLDAVDDAAQQVAVQYRVAGGLWQNVFYDADVTTGGSATEVTAVDVTLGADANGAADLEVRVLTTNAVGSDEWVGIDDILVTSTGGGGGDVTPPVLTDTTPDDEAGNVAATANIVLQFSEAVVAGTGSFTLTNGAGDTRVIAIADAQVTISGNTITIDPTADLVGGTTYALTSDAGIVEDAAGNDFDGLQAGELDFSVLAPLATREIGEIQGLGHTSPFLGTTQRVEGVVTAVDTTGGRGFFIQSTDAGDGDSRTSEGLFVFTNAAPTVTVGQLVRVTGTVAEFLPGGNVNNLTVTQLTVPSIELLGNATVVPILLGQGGLLAPTEIIDNDSFGVYDPAQDGIDFYESIEGQLVTVQDALVVGFTGAFSEAWSVTDNGANATGLGGRGGIALSEGDFNPERIQLDNDAGLTGGVNPFGASLSQGDRLGNVNAVVRYDFGQYEFAVTQIVTPVVDVTLAKEVTALAAGDADTLAIASYNLLNIDSLDPQVKFDILAQDVVVNLKAPAIIALQEVQDEDGEGAGANLSGEPSIARLITAISAAGGPTYTYVEIAPGAPNVNGGAPNANIRNGYLYNDAVVDLVAGSLALIDPANPAFDNSRKPLVAQWIYNEQTFTTVNVHSSSRSGSESLFGSNQPPVNAAESARIAQATVIRDYVDGIVAADADAKVVVLGDFNGFLFEQPFDILTAGGALSNLQELLPEAERYTFQFDGQNQAIDHLLVTANLLGGAQFDTVALNAERFGLSGVTSGSDHDAIVALLEFAAPPPVELIGSSRNDTIVGTAANEIIRGLAGADKLFGNGGDDLIEGGDGADIIQGGAGTNQLFGGAFSDRFAGEAVQGVHIIDGGAGIDTFLANGAPGAAVTVDLAAGTVTGGYADDSTLTAVENATVVEGAPIAATLLGSAVGNQLTGGILADILDGAAGNDRIIGGGSADQLSGGAGNDRFIFRPGEVEGDVIDDFDGRGDLFGDILQFTGFGQGAALSHVGNTWTITYDGGVTESFTLNVMQLASNDVVFTG